MVFIRGRPTCGSHNSLLWLTRYFSRYLKSWYCISRFDRSTILVISNYIFESSGCEIHTISNKCVSNLLSSLIDTYRISTIYNQTLKNNFKAFGTMQCTQGWAVFSIQLYLASRFNYKKYFVLRYIFINLIIVSSIS